MRVSAPDDCSPSQRGDLPAGAIRLGVEVTLWARGEVQVPANPYYALLIDENGKVHEATLAGCEPALPQRLLRRAESVSGWLSFEVPDSSRSFTLSYAPRLTLPGQPLEELLFRLPR